MKTGKTLYQRVLAWLLVITLVLSTGINAWADEPESETETITETITETQQETVGESESDSTETVPETENWETQSETESAEVQTEAVNEKKAPKKSAREEVSGLFSATVNDVTFNGKPVTGGNNVNVTQNKYWELGFNMSWNQTGTYTGNPGDTITFELFSITSDTGAPIITGNGLGEATLKGIVNGEELTLGTGDLGYKLQGNTAVITYTVTFGELIKNKTNISGTLKGNFIVECNTIGEKLTVKDGDNQLGTITVVRESNTLPGYGYPSVEKKNSSYSTSAGTLTWLITASDIAGEGFEQFRQNSTHTPATNYQDIIITDTLDEYQSFYLMEGGQNVNSVMFKLKIYVPIPTSTGAMGQTVVAQYNVYLKDLVNNGLITYKDTEAEVLQAPRSFTIVKESDGTGKRLVLNIGAPGNGGLKIDQMLNNSGNASGVQEYKDIIEKERKLYEYQLAEAAKVNLTNDTDIWECVALPLSDGTYYEGKDSSFTIVGAKNTIGRIKEILAGYELAADYYQSGEAWLYALEMYLTVKVDVEKAKEGTSVIKNSWTYQSENASESQTVDTENKWVATIAAEAAKGEVQIFKADAANTTPEGELTEAISLAGDALKDVGFEVYEKGTSTPLTFTINNGRYVADNNGTITTIKTDRAGSLILSGLLAGKKYVIKETEALDGYYSESKEIEFEIDADKALFYLMKNTARGVELVKVNKGDPDERLRGAEFKLYTYENDIDDATEVTGFTLEGAEYVYGSGVATLTTLADGGLKIIKLPAGNYYLQETRAPYGYELSDEKHPFVLGDTLDGKAVVSLGNIENKKIPADVDASLEASKSLTGATLSADQFTFTAELISGDAANVTGLTDSKVSAKNNGSGVVAFAGQTYSKAGTYIYEISEKNGGSTINGITYDNTKYYAKVVVTDDGNGALTAVVTYHETYTGGVVGEASAAGAVFVNSYTTSSATAALEASKSLAGATLSADQFTFTAELISGDAANVNGLTDSKVSAKNNGSGVVAFAGQTYSKAGTYIYEISEKNGGTIKDGINYDGNSYYGAVEIRDNQAGQLVVDSVKYYAGYSAENGLSEELEEAVFVNEALIVDTVALDTKVIDPVTGEEVNGTRTPGVIQSGSPSESEIIIDTVAYSGLKPNTKYVIDGHLWHYSNFLNPENGELYREYQEDGNGAVVNSTYVFSTDGTGSGEIEVVYSFNGKNLGTAELWGSYLVAYETIYEYDANEPDNKGAEVISHTDSKDKDQTIHYIHGSSSYLYSTSYTVTKVWDDKDNAAGERPASIQVQLYRDGQKFMSEQTLDESNHWTHIWADLPQYQDGTHIDSVYTVKEVTVPDHYTALEAVDGTITNTHKAKDTKAEILKVDEAGNALAGAELALYDAEGGLIAEWTSTDSAYQLADKLIPGEIYTLKEKKAPVGYLLAEDVSFTAEAAGNVTKVTMTDKKEEETDSETETETETQTETKKKTSTEKTQTGKKTTITRTGSSVKTGDTTQLMLYVGIMLSAVLAMSLAVMKRRKQHR